MSDVANGPGGWPATDLTWHPLKTHPDGVARSHDAPVAVRVAPVPLERFIGITASIGGLSVAISTILPRARSGVDGVGFASSVFEIRWSSPVSDDAVTIAVRALVLIDSALACMSRALRAVLVSELVIAALVGIVPLSMWDSLVDILGFERSVVGISISAGIGYGVRSLGVGVTVASTFV